MIIHVVKSGETVSSIAAEYGVSAERLIMDNELETPNQLVVGQTVVVQFPKETHTVKEGESLSDIASMHGMTLNQLYRNNTNLHARPDIFPGQTLMISYDQTKEGSMEVNGYAYPFVNMELLRRTMPFTTYLTPFTYGFDNDGNLVELNDMPMIRLAEEYGVAPLMHLSTLTPDGVFSNELSQRLFNNPQMQENLIGNILSTMAEKNYRGLDVDFEFVSNAQQYVDFVKKLKERLAPFGYPVIVALAPKISTTQPGLLYEGHDFKGLGEAADAVFVMTYEWGYTYGPPMAVAPLPNVRQVLDYAVSQIPAEKIYMGMPNYGYDWPLPYIKGETKAQSISNYEAVNIARRNNAEIMFDEKARAPFFNYTAKDGTEHVVWFEDARSIREKLALVPEYGLRGVGYWNFMRPFPQNWLVLNSLYNIIQF